MDSRDLNEDRTKALLEQIKPDLLSLLKNSPEYGSCGIDFHFHQSEIIRTSIRAEITRKVKPRSDSRL
jgi:hypothetical protein